MCAWLPGVYMCVRSWGLFINFSSQSRRKLKGKSTWVRFWTETLRTSTEELSAFFKCHTPKFFFHSAGFWMGRQEKYLGRPLMDFYCYRSALSALKLSDVMQIIKLTMKRGHMGLHPPTACLHDVAHSRKKNVLGCRSTVAFSADVMREYNEIAFRRL